jgi:predicted DNA-binding antitoxin AbrB/MazE fold protein
MDFPFMPQALKAIYHNGVFILQTACDLPEGTEVELFIQSPQVVSPPIDEADFWLETSQVSLDSIWDNTEDDVYAQLLKK